MTPCSNLWNLIDAYANAREALNATRQAKAYNGAAIKQAENAFDAAKSALAIQMKAIDDANANQIAALNKKLRGEQ